jgi:amino-acid N-acetyltransferase
VTLRPAAAGDREAVLALLASASLPDGGLDDQYPDAFVVAHRGDDLVGVAAAERYGDAALLRSVAVTAAVRGLGLGITLSADRIVAARDRGARAIYLLTTTAAPFYDRFGFKRLPRAELPAALASAPEVSSVCPASATCMVLPLTAR